MVKRARRRRAPETIAVFREEQLPQVTQPRIAQAFVHLQDEPVVGLLFFAQIARPGEERRLLAGAQQPEAPAPRFQPKRGVVPELAADLHAQPGRQAFARKVNRRIAPRFEDDFLA